MHACSSIKDCDKNQFFTLVHACFSDESKLILENFLLWYDNILLFLMNQTIMIDERSDLKFENENCCNFWMNSYSLNMSIPWHISFHSRYWRMWTDRLFLCLSNRLVVISSSNSWKYCQQEDRYSKFVMPFERTVHVYSAILYWIYLSKWHKFQY